MNGYQTESSPYDYGAASTSPPAAPSHGDSTMAEDFENEGPDVFDQAAPRFDPMNPSQARNSALADLKDPIQVHLLTETALSDSKEYEIISQEEVDRLKKLCQTLGQRVESTRANLAIQSKYRDAAVSMAKLYAAGKSEGDLQNDQSAREAETERQATERICDELSRELFNLEKRLLAPQRRLLQHTAGILQLTHKVSKKKTQPPSQLNNGIPGSPESLYTFSHGRDSLGPAGDDNYFEDPSHYQLDLMEGLQTRQQHQKNVIEIPVKSPVREQANQLRGEIEKAREENTQLVKTISEMEQKMETLNISLRETIVRFNPEVNNDYLEPPHESAPHGSKPGDMLRSQIDYLESGLVAVQAEQESFTSTGQAAPEPFPGAGSYAGAGSFTGLGGDSDEVETVLIGLWNRIQSGFAEIKQRKEERRKHRADRGLRDDDDASDDDGFDPAEAYSLTAFSTRVQWLYSQASTLKDQKSVLKRQIKQQRELNNKTDAEKDEEIERRQEELEQTRQLLDRAEKDALDAQSMLADALQDLEEAREAPTSSGGGASEAELQAHAMRIESLEAEVQARSTRLESLDAEAQERSARTESLEEEIQARSARIESLEDELETRNARIDSLEAEVQARTSSLESLEGEVQARTMKIESLDAEAQARGARTESLEAEVQARSARIESLEAEIQARSARIESLEAEIQARSARIESLEAVAQDRGPRTESLEAEIQARSARIESLEGEIQARSEKIQSFEATVAGLSAELDVVARDKAAAEEAAKHSKADLSRKEKELAQREDELELLNMSLAELKTEVTIARAELDGAYGSRAERAADVAALKNNAEVVKLSNQVERLKKELAGTIQDLESITKETIGTERERVDLEHKLDDALSVQSAMEADLQRSRDQVSKLQDDLDSERFKVIPGQGGTSRLGAGAAVLSEQFRLTMREERKRFHEEMRDERLKCRRLEEELGRLKRSQGPGRSPLSPR